MEEMSILKSIKKLLGPADCDNYFDQDIIMLINSAFSRLNSLGVGPIDPFAITGEDETWNDFACDGVDTGMIKEYVYLRVRVIFDQPGSSYVLNALNERLDELTFVLNAMNDNE